jgi:hypothetical protein
MRTHHGNLQHTQFQVESLERKTLLSAGFGLHRLAPHVMPARVTGRTAAEFSGTLTGNYSHVSVPFAGKIDSYNASGTLSAAGSTQLSGTLRQQNSDGNERDDPDVPSSLPNLFILPGGDADVDRGSARPGKLSGQFVMRNDGGTMLVKVVQSQVPGHYTYRVALARGDDRAFVGETGDLAISQTPAVTAPYAVSGQATMTFTPG